jgi:DNA-binding LacI/PurR family transcriptional regulator
MNPMGSLSDISKATGLSISAVSEILRDHPRYRPETRQLVFEAARKLNYRPNLMARGLKTGRSMTVGIIVGSFHTPVTMEKLADIETTAREAGYTPFVALGAPDSQSQLLETVNHLLDRQVDGLIIMSAVEMGKPVLKRLTDSRTAVVYADWTPQAPGWKLTFDRLPAMRQAAAHLAQLQHKSGIFVCTPSDWKNPGTKFTLWRQACSEQGIDLQVSEAFLFSPSKHYEQQAYDLMRQRAREGKLPGLLVMNNDSCAVAAMAAMQDAGLSIPQDLSVIGFDDTLESHFSRPSLTTIHQPRYEVGVTAFEMLRQAMEDPGQEPVVKTIDFKFIARQSTGLAPGVSPRAKGSDTH